MPPLLPVVKILKKNWAHRKNLGESEDQTFEGFDRKKSVNFSALATSSIRLFAVLGEEDE